MKERDVTIYMAIENPDASVSLSALYIPTKQKYSMPSINFDKHSMFGTEFWDNGNFVFGEFYTFLSKWKNRTLSIEDLETDIYQEYEAWKWKEEDVDELIDIIEQGIDFGWNKLE